MAEEPWYDYEDVKRTKQLGTKYKCIIATDNTDYGGEDDQPDLNAGEQVDVKVPLPPKKFKKFSKITFINPVDSHKQIEFKTKDDYLSWTNITEDDYSLRLDERTTVPFHHLGLACQTGSGKSFFIQMLVDQVISKKVKHELFIIDPKRTDVFQMSMRFIGRDRTADKTTAIELKNFHERMLKRQDELQEFFQKNSNKTYQDAHLPALILLIDEFGALRESWKTLPKKERDEVDSILADIAFMGRQIGCIFWTATQQMNAQTMPTAIRDQLVLKVVLGYSDEQTYRTLFISRIGKC